ncbi:MAG: hypothetical protein ACJAZV_001413 [Roseivirga sp.]|jgi:hypothetical protein
MTLRFRSKHISLIGAILLLFTICLNSQTNSALSSGKWVKMEFTKEGVYKIDRTSLSNMGFDVTNLDPRKLAIYGNKGGMLPQSLSIERAKDLTENAISVKGETDGVFNNEDYLLFYVDRVNALNFNKTDRSFSVTKNLYAEKLNYFLTLKEDKGLRINELADLGQDNPPITFYNKIIDHELDETNILGSGREWFGESFGTENRIAFDFQELNIAPNQPINVNMGLMTQAFSSTSVKVDLNNQTVGNIVFTSIPNTRYGIKGAESGGNFSLNSSFLSDLNNLNLEMTFDKQGANNALAYLNFLLLNVPSILQFNAEALIFRSTSALDDGISTFKINNANANLLVWDVTNPITPSSQNHNLNGSTLSFGAFSDELHTYVAFDPSNLPAPDGFIPLPNQDLRGEAVPDLVIVSADEFLTEANQLADFRRSADQLTVLVTTPQQIYNEFSSGRPDVTAIRDFMSYLKSKSERLKYLLLFGKGSYDYKDRIEGNTNFVPTYEARSSLHPLTSYSSDDYFGFLDPEEGDWIENTSGDHIMDIGIGRIPSTSLVQAKIAVDKIINYQNSITGIGDWRRRIVFVADDGDNNLHQRDADKLATLVDTSYTSFNVRKIYLDAYPQIRSPNGESSPKAENALLDAVEQGVLIMNFTGHGAETGWMQERILTLESIDNWKNSTRLPLVVTATCEFGRNDDPMIVSGAEVLMFKANGGAIGLVTSARPVFSSSNYTLNLALYGSILEKPNGEFQRLGDIIKYTKNNALNGANNRNFILLGDPSMRLSYPKNEIKVTKINNRVLDSTADTLRALQSVIIEGEIVNAQHTVSSFNGELDFSLFDKRNSRQTLGTESIPFEYLERDSQLFNGKASIKNGLFKIEFVVPKNINYQFGAGKMSMYAFANGNLQDAFGAKIDFVLGGTSSNPINDNAAPDIRAFINDSTSVKKIIVKRDASLFLKVFDESGINISESGIGQNLSATLNDSITYNLNGFYQAVKDDFRKGEVDFPLRSLPLGINILEIKVWDNFNNLATTSIQFEVTSENSTLISEINSYPNPLVSSTTFSVSHNSAGEALEILIEIINSKGETVTSLNSKIESGTNTQSIMWDGTDRYGGKLGKGIYIYNVFLRSINSGKTHVKRQKLIISY